MIDRRTFLRQSSLAMGATALPLHVWLKDFLAAESSLINLRGNVYLYSENRGGSIVSYLADDGIVVVDTQFPDPAKDVIRLIQAQHDQQIDLLINTHHHGDHTGGNIAFQGLVDKVVAHTNSKANQMRVAQARNAEESQLYPDTTFDSEWSQQVGSETVKLRYFGPAHTNGDAMIHFENANVVHMGDLMFNRRFPYIDRSAGANIQSWIEVLGKARKTFDNDTIFVFGHSGDGCGVRGTRQDLAAMQKYLSNVLKFVKKELKAGKPEETIMKATAIPGSPEWKGSGIERSLSAALEELKEG